MRGGGAREEEEADDEPPADDEWKGGRAVEGGPKATEDSGAKPEVGLGLLSFWREEGGALREEVEEEEEEGVG